MIYIANARIPTEKAHGYQIMKMCESFADLGVKVDLILPYRSNKQFRGVASFKHYLVKNNFTIKKIYCPDPVFLMNKSGWYIKIQSLFFSLGLLIYLVFKSRKDEIIYTRDEYFLSWLTWFPNKVIWEAHDLLRSRQTKQWLKCFRIMTITQGLKDEMTRLGVPEEKILVAPDGVDLKLFAGISNSKKDLREELALPLEEKIILYAGHLYDWKGADTLAQAATFLKNENVKFVFVGGIGKDLEAFTKSYGGEKNILIVGQVNRSVVPKYLKAADVLILPNSAKREISSHYSSPLKLFEYMASGRPIIASRLDSLQEVLTDEECIFFSPDDAIDLAQKISHLLSNKELAEKVAAKAGEKVKDYTWENRAKNIIKFIKYAGSVS